MDILEEIQEIKEQLEKLQEQLEQQQLPLCSSKAIEEKIIQLKSRLQALRKLK